MRNVSEKSSRENQNTHFMSKNLLFFENRAVFLNNVGKYFTTGKLQMTK
jgi:hypothetical protein